MAKRKFSKFSYLIMFLEACVLFPIIFLLSYLIPYSSLYSVTQKIGRFFLLISTKKKEIVRQNLAIIYPQKEFSPQELNEITSIMAGYELRIILEMIAFTRMDFQELLSCFQIMDSQQIAKLNKLKPSIGVTLHCGNWELLACIYGHLDMPLSCLVERQFNPWIDRYLQYLRKKLGIIVVYNEISQMRPLFRTLNQEGRIGLVADQTYWFDPLFIPFFGKKASVPQGIATLINRVKLPIFFGYSVYKNKGVYGLFFDIDSTCMQPYLLPKDTLIKFIYQKYEKFILLDVKNWYTLGSKRWELTASSYEEWKKNPDSSQF